MKTVLRLLFIALGIQSVHADPVLLLQLRKAPRPIMLRALEKLSSPQELLEQKNTSLAAKMPTGSSRLLLKHYLGNGNFLNVNGILALYAGYADYSNRDGSISFPLRHSPATKVSVVITPQIDLAMIDQNTVSNLVAPSAQSEVASYLFEKKKDKNNSDFWSVSSSSEPISSGAISQSALVLVTKPKNIFVATGDYLSEKETANVVLPQVFYVVGGNDATSTLLKALDSLHYFEPIQMEKKEISPTLQQSIIRNN